jgi:CheY-like chemotaxis protein
MQNDNVILVVDDDPLMLSGTARILEKGGYTVVAAWGDENIEFSGFKLHSGFVPSFTAGRGT